MIKVNKEIGKRLDFMLNDSRYTTESILEQHTKGWNDQKNKCLNELRLSQLAECLFLGYEVEETVEDKILENYKELSDLRTNDEYSEGYKNGYLHATKSILNKYNIKIEGINA